jgi:hypothetical protein
MVPLEEIADLILIGGAAQLPFPLWAYSLPSPDPTQRGQDAPAPQPLNFEISAYLKQSRV